MNALTALRFERIALELEAAQQNVEATLNDVTWLFGPPKIGHNHPPAATAEEIPMSDISKLFHAVADAFEKAVGAAPAESQPGLQNAAATVRNAATQAEAAFPALVEGAVNAVMNMFPVATPFEPVADAFISEVIAALEAKKSTAPKA